LTVTFPVFDIFSIRSRKAIESAMNALRRLATIKPCKT